MTTTLNARYEPDGTALFLSKLLSSEFFSLCHEYKNLTTFSVLPTKGYQCELIVQFLGRLKLLFDNGKCDHGVFIEELFQSSLFLPLEIIWILDQSCIISIKAYLSMFDSNSEMTKHIAKSLISISNSTGSTLTCVPAESKVVQQNILSVILESSCCENMDLDLDDCPHTGSKICCYVIKMMASICGNSEQSSEVSLENLIDILSIVNVERGHKILFFVSLLNSLFKMPSCPITDIFKTQDNFYKDCKTGNKHLGLLYSEVFKLMSSVEVIKYLKQSVFTGKSALNWFNILYFLSFFASNQENGFTELKVILSHLIQLAFHNCDSELLLCIFLIARFCCSHSFHYFPSYLQWFSSSFSSDSNRPVNSKTATLFFLNFLTELIENDLPHYLKVHINKVPSVPIECQYLLSEYVKLVKTKLSDLDESMELGLFENQKAMNTMGTAKFDVHSLLKIFEENNEIPCCVLEASMFCRHYYEKKFLPELLSQFDGKHSPRHRVILKLHAIDKVTNSLFVIYKQKVDS